MISREDVAKELYVQRWVRTGDTRESAEAAWKAGWANHDVQECRADADAILALIQSASEVPVQRDERAEKLGEQLDAMVAECNANHRTIGRLEERAQKAEEERDTWKDCIAEEMAENINLFNLLGVMPEIEAGRAGTDAVVEAVRRLQADLATARAEILTNDALLAERQRILDALPCPDHGPCVPHVLEWIEKVRNAEALAANLKRVDNERAIELMRVRRDLITVRDALGGLMEAAEDAHSQGRITAALCAAIADPALAACREK